MNKDDYKPEWHLKLKELAMKYPENSKERWACRRFCERVHEHKEKYPQFNAGRVVTLFIESEWKMRYFFCHAQMQLVKRMARKREDLLNGLVYVQREEQEDWA